MKLQASGLVIDNGWPSGHPSLKLFFMNVWIQGTGKAADMNKDYFAEVDQEAAENLVKKGYATIVDKPAPVETIEPIKEIKPITLAENVTGEPQVFDHVVTAEDLTVNPELAEQGVKEGDVIGVPVTEQDDKLALIALKEEEFKSATTKEDKKRIKKELDALKK